MGEFSIEEVYKAFKIKDEKKPFRTWLKIKKKKSISKRDEKSKKKNKKDDGHIDIYA